MGASVIPALALQPTEPIRILDQAFNDFTDQCRHNLDAVLGVPD